MFDAKLSFAPENINNEFRPFHNTKSKKNVKYIKPKKNNKYI